MPVTLYNFKSFFFFYFLILFEVACLNQNLSFQANTFLNVVICLPKKDVMNEVSMNEDKKRRSLGWVLKVFQQHLNGFNSPKELVSEDWKIWIVNF